MEDRGKPSLPKQRGRARLGPRQQDSAVATFIPQDGKRSRGQERACGSSAVTKLALELGGYATFMVYDDADIEMAVKSSPQRRPEAPSPRKGDPPLDRHEGGRERRGAHR